MSLSDSITLSNALSTCSLASTNLKHMASSVSFGSTDTSASFITSKSFVNSIERAIFTLLLGSESPPIWAERRVKTTREQDARSAKRARLNAPQKLYQKRAARIR